MPTCTFFIKLRLNYALQETIPRCFFGGLEKGGCIASDMEEAVFQGDVANVLPTHSLNVIGFFCPVPVSEAKRALLTMKKGEVLEVWADDPETLHDMPLLIDRSYSNLLSVEHLAGEYRFLIEVKQ